jgi:predicted Zn finger-like uncharacterized protein
MRVVCDNCGASYKIPDSKLVKEVNHATCRKCGHRIVISRRDGPNTEPGVGDSAQGAQGGQGDGSMSSDAASTLINEGGGRPPMRPPMGFGGADEVPAAMGRAPAPEPREATVPRDSAFAASMSARGNDAPTLPPPSGPTPQQLAAQQQQQAAQAAYAAQQQAVFAAQQQQAAYAAQQQQLAMMNAQYPQNPAMTGAFPVGGPSVHQAAPLPAYPPPAAPMVAAAPRPHDPAPDLSWVMIASFGSAIGAGVLATSSSQPQTLIGLGISLWSAITSLMVLVTGDRGRREASVVGATVMGVVFSGLLTGAFYAAQPKGPAVAETTPPAGDVSEAMATLGADAAAPPAEATADPVAAVATPPSAPPEAAPPPTEPAPQVAATTPPPVVATAPTSSGSSSSGSSSSGSSSSKPTGSSSSGSSSSKPTGSSSSGSSTTASKPPATTAAPASSGVPLSVLDTMLKTNANVKKCFVLYKQETGELPSRVDVKLTVQPSGKTTAASVKTEQYKGTSLDGCLGTAIKGITFPGFEGSAQDYSYPFVLR